jgi:acyl-coenzyme A synthetase/AMP-(fatty) acid ligase
MRASRMPLSRWRQTTEAGLVVGGRTRPEGVADAAVVGVRDRDGEEIPKAFVVRSATSPDLTPDEVMASVAAQVAPYKKVRAVEFVDAIPRSAAGKILRKELRARETAAVVTA